MIVVGGDAIVAHCGLDGRVILSILLGANVPVGANGMPMGGEK